MVIYTTKLSQLLALKLMRAEKSLAVWEELAPNWGVDSATTDFAKFLIHKEINWIKMQLDCVTPSTDIAGPAPETIQPMAHE